MRTFEPSEEKKQKAIEKRTELKKLSLKFKEVAKQSNKPINEFVVDFYKSTKGVTELKTFEEWRKLGFTVKKGESSYLVWAKPVASTQAKERAEQTETDPKEDYFPVCHLFDRSQVQEMKPKAQA